jgi:endonuclease/exonuclease/phosphatase family metal-dependent hydrolase
MVLFVLITKNWMCITCLRSRIGYAHKRLCTSSRIRVLSLNIFLCSIGVSFGDDNWKESRVEEFLSRYLTEYDIVCLQECFGGLSTLCNKIVDRAEQMGFYWRVVPDHPSLASLKFMDSGLVILSRYPIVHAEAHVFQDAIYVDKLAAKSFQYCTINLSSISTPRLLHVINTHLQSDYQLSDPLALNVKFRQLTQIRKFIDNLGELSEPLLLAGDFNINAIYWTDKLKVLPDRVSDEYIQILDILGFKPCHDVMRPSGDGGRLPTSFCTYERNGICRELDTRYRDTNDPTLLDHPEWVNLPRSVDYLWIVPPPQSWLRVSSASINKLLTKDPANQIQCCSDHYGVDVTLVLDQESTLNSTNNSRFKL